MQWFSHTGPSTPPEKLDCNLTFEVVTTSPQSAQLDRAHASCPKDTNLGLRFQIIFYLRHMKQHDLR